MTAFARIATRAFTRKAANVIGTLAAVQTGIRFALIVFKVAQLTGKSCWEY